jgi:hypothetical protein
MKPDVTPPVAERQPTSTADPTKPGAWPFPGLVAIESSGNGSSTSVGLAWFTGAEVQHG